MCQATASALRRDSGARRPRMCPPCIGIRPITGAVGTGRTTSRGARHRVPRAAMLDNRGTLPATMRTIPIPSRRSRRTQMVLAIWKRVLFYSYKSKDRYIISIPPTPSCQDQQPTTDPTLQNVVGVVLKRTVALPLLATLPHYTIRVESTSPLKAALVLKVAFIELLPIASSPFLTPLQSVLYAN